MDHTIDLNHLIAAGVGLQLLFALAHHFVRSPRQQAQLDAIEGRVNGLLASIIGKDSG